TYGVTIGGVSGSRTCYFETEKNSGVQEGHIYEYTNLQGKDAIKAAADYYIKGDYVSVIGNKASGMLGFDGVISELYAKTQGRLLGYKVQEELEILKVKGTYHTLWFNLWDIAGINQIKVTEKADNPSDKSTVNTYLNGSETLLSPTYNKKFTVKTSRKYDVELRDRYYYSIVDEKLTCTATQIPMMFIQDDNDVDTNFSDFPADMLADNGITVSVQMATAVLARIREDYTNYIPVFQTNKENMTSEAIVAYLNSFAE
ncbi:MAG: hypothetical protein HUJ60_02430, partial [Bacilli bacterium]|nr:hypothetical protein [Bacilli bacterium]